MRLLVVSDAPILSKNQTQEAYAPYVKEMDIWMRHVTHTSFVCPTRYRRSLLTTSFVQQDFDITSLCRLEFHTLGSSILSLIMIPYQIFVLFIAMLRADHIHLRAPGNLCLLACMVQIMLPRKRKTVKYAGNWDPTSKQPIAYRIQKRILSNTFLSKNINVLVYGEWAGRTKNITPFFTASYAASEIKKVTTKNWSEQLNAVFVGTMGTNKAPLETVALIKDLIDLGTDIRLDMYGDGPERKRLDTYITENALQDRIYLHGNKEREVIQEAYQKAHITLLFSKSEGWPKAIAEGMFYGCVPIATPVSCVPWMLDDGERGILVNDITKASKLLENKLSDRSLLEVISTKALNWSQQYTLDLFETEIKKMLV